MEEPEEIMDAEQISINVALRKLQRDIDPYNEFIERHIEIVDEDIRKKKSIIDLEKCTIELYTRTINRNKLFKEDKIISLSKLESEKRLVLLGEPGAGKSVYLKKRALARIKDIKKWKNEKIPIYIELKGYKIKDKEKLNGRSSLEYSILNKIEQSDLKDIAEIMLHEGWFEIYLDGLDEIADDKIRKELIEDLKELRNIKNNKIVITSRTNVYSEIPNFKEFVVQPIEINDLEKFLIKSYNKTPYDYERLYENIKSDEQILNICKNPLLLSFVLEIYEKKYNQGQELNVSNRAELYKEIIETSFLGREKNREKEHIEETHSEETINTLSEIAFLMQTDKETTISNKGKINYSKLQEIVNKNFVSNPNIIPKIIDIIIKNNLVIRDIEDNSFEFIHPTLKEYFCAKNIAEQIDSGKITVEQAYEKYLSYEDYRYNNLKGRHLLPAWQETLNFLINLVDKENAARLIDVMTKEYYNFEKRFNGLFGIKGAIRRGIRICLSEDSLDHYNPFEEDLEFATSLSKKREDIKFISNKLNHKRKREYIEEHEDEVYDFLSIIRNNLPKAFRKDIYLLLDKNDADSRILNLVAPSIKIPGSSNNKFENVRDIRINSAISLSRLSFVPEEFNSFSISNDKNKVSLLELFTDLNLYDDRIIELIMDRNESKDIREKAYFALKQIIKDNFFVLEDIISKFGEDARHNIVSISSMVGRGYIKDDFIDYVDRIKTKAEAEDKNRISQDIINNLVSEDKSVQSGAAEKIAKAWNYGTEVMRIKYAIGEVWAVYNGNIVHKPIDEDEIYFCRVIGDELKLTLLREEPAYLSKIKETARQSTLSEEQVFSLLDNENHKIRWIALKLLGEKIVGKFLQIDKSNDPDSFLKEYSISEMFVEYTSKLARLLEDKDISVKFAAKETFDRIKEVLDSITYSKSYLFNNSISQRYDSILDGLLKSKDEITRRIGMSMFVKEELSKQILEEAFKDSVEGVRAMAMHLAGKFKYYSPLIVDGLKCNLDSLAADTLIKIGDNKIVDKDNKYSRLIEILKNKRNISEGNADISFMQKTNIYSKEICDLIYNKNSVQRQTGLEILGETGPYLHKILDIALNDTLDVISSAKKALLKLSQKKEYRAAIIEDLLHETNGFIFHPSALYLLKEIYAQNKPRGFIPQEAKDLK